MTPAGGPTGPRQSFEGPPSEQARAALSERLRREVADARMRFEEAGLRAEAHRLLGQHDAAADVVHEQERILAEVQDRLGRAVSAAVVERDAEQVLADLVATERLHPVASPPARDPDPAPVPAERGRTPALAGVTSIVAVIGLAAAAILGLTRGMDQVEVTEAAADSTPSEQVTDDAPLAGPTPLATSSARPGGDASDPATVAPSPDAASPTPASPAPTTEDGTDEPSPTPAPGLDTVVQEIIDAVQGLDDAGLDRDDEDPAPGDVDSSVPELDPLLEGLDADGSGWGDDTTAGDDDVDGFVPGGTAQ